MINRRRFLSLGALALAYQATPFTGLPLVRSLNKLKVLVVGAGPAGLSAAYELQKAGHDVHVFEARDRVGGRIHTLREPFDKGMYAEAGALYLTSNNPGVAYAREFGLKLNEVVFGSDLGTVVYIKGQRLLEYPGQKAPEYPFPLPDSDRGQTISGLQGKYHRAPIYGNEWLGELNRPEYPQPDYAHLDDISLLEFWKQNGASPATIELMKLRYYGSYSDDLDKVSVLQLHREAASFLGMEGGYQIAGGNDRLCSELANRLANPVQLESPVVMVEQNDRAAAVTIRAKGGEMKRFSGDSLIVTIPPQVMGAVDLSSAVSEELIRIFDNIAGVEATRTFIQTSRRFWSDENLDGNAVTDMRMGFMRHTTLTQDSQKGILESFANNANARYLATLPYKERVALVKQQMNLVYPGLTDHAENEASYCWGDDPWSGANLSSFKPGQITKFHGLLAENAGRVFFAGDTYGGVPGYSHSAFISGQRTAALVNEMGS